MNKTVLTPKDLNHQIETFDMTKPTDTISHAFKVAKTHQEYYRKNSEEFKMLEKFKNTLLKELRSRQKGPTIEELDAEAEEHNRKLEEAKALLERID